MIIVVSDTSVLADLERGRCLEACFRLPECEFVVSDLLYRRELADASGPALCALGLNIEALSSEELAAAQTVLQRHSTLSLLDAYAFTLAVNRAWTLLTGEGDLQSVAHQQQVHRCGVLWVFDQLFERQMVDGKTLVLGLTVISEHPRCRLPKAEVQARLSMFGKAKC